jgi:hypothetical protein
MLLGHVTKIIAHRVRSYKCRGAADYGRRRCALTPAPGLAGLDRFEDAAAKAMITSHTAFCCVGGNVR